jgi:hypothetical protein
MMPAKLPKQPWVVFPRYVKGLAQAPPDHGAPAPSSEESPCSLRIPVKSATHSDFGRTLNPVISDTYGSVATLVA